MNAHAHLLSLGWAGPGHALDSRPDDLLPKYKQKGHRGLAYDPAKVGNTGTGLVKPLSISQRKSRFGIGKKAHEPASGNQWWLKGFESALGNIGKSESERESSGTNTPLEGNAAVRFGNTGGKHAGLYGFFIKGQLMQGTILEQDQDAHEENSRGKKRKSDALNDDDDDETSDQSSSSGELKSRNKQTKGKKAAKDFEAVASFLIESRQDEKRRTRKEKPSDMEQFAQVGEYLELKEAADSKKKRSKKRKSETISKPEDVAEEDASDLVVVETKGGRIETKEERRERRRRRKDEKAKKMTEIIPLNGRDKVQMSNHTDTSNSTEAAAAAKAVRRAERKKRKAREGEKLTSMSAVAV